MMAFAAKRLRSDVTSDFAVSKLQSMTDCRQRLHTSVVMQSGLCRHIKFSCQYSAKAKKGSRGENKQEGKREEEKS